jgi:hypothetical protein
MPNRSRSQGHSVTNAHPNIPLPQRLATNCLRHQRARGLALSPLRYPRSTPWQPPNLIETTSIPNPSTSLGLQPRQQQPRKLGGTLYRLSSPYAPKASWDDRCRSRNIGVERGESIAGAVCAAGAPGGAARFMEPGGSVAATWALGLMSCWDDVAASL